MQLDRFTQKAQEAIIAAQELAQRLHSPVLDAEHLLSALIEPDDGVPAETLRRLGVDLPTIRGDIAAALARRARIEGGSLTLDPRAKAVVDRAEDEARRLGDEYVSTEHLLLGVADAGGEGQAILERHGAGREALLQALQSVRGGQRVTSPNPESTYAALEKYGRDLTAEARAGKLDPVIGRDDEIRRVIQVLSRRTKNNPVLIGEPGVGKTAIAEASPSASSAATSPRRSRTSASGRSIWARSSERCARSMSHARPGRRLRRWRPHALPMASAA